MSTEIKAPQFPESVADGTVATWHKAVGEAVSRDELLVDIETDKVVLEVVAPADGVLTAIHKDVGETVLSEELLGIFEAGAAASTPAPVAAEPAAEAPAEAPAGPGGAASPAARKAASELGVELAQVRGSGRDGRITKEDVEKAATAPASAPAQAAAAPSAPAAPASEGLQRLPGVGQAEGQRPERRVPMTRLRASIARRLVEAQQTAAMLTTFNEVNMQPIMDLRARYKDDFEKAHNGTRLGFMSFFVRAATEALKRFPAVNGSIDGNDIVYHGYYDVGVAVGTDRGLVVPIIRDADGLSLAQIEESIRDYGLKARDGKLALEDMAGGTFTISNGGVFGSLMSTPILNPPQTAILGMHKIQDRPMAVNGQVVIQPMMYLALSYDHRLIDGSEAVRFLVTIKDLLEEPARMLLDI
ncbi:MAG: 2-oxoglutarate dehydrogenase complex dihydrolipoyllysine-residue succinyltransferase [Gammaproteobacteria bacterium]|jgi:2-oxoglutarate dehydrogenase E2 component (dihydrolipoamide succinyltransferase)|nr:2-oxoglutarate dehydrogenase complex dihydrolipoyllysine-residue succinyltransferase [Gammaproteobacteria bacterium]